MLMCLKKQNLGYGRYSAIGLLLKLLFSLVFDFIYVTL